MPDKVTAEMVAVLEDMAWMERQLAGALEALRKRLGDKAYDTPEPHYAKADAIEAVLAEREHYDVICKELDDAWEANAKLKA